MWVLQEMYCTVLQEMYCTTGNVILNGKLITSKFKGSGDIATYDTTIILRTSLVLNIIKTVLYHLLGIETNMNSAFLFFSFNI
jgi:hypothetical protein